MNETRAGTDADTFQPEYGKGGVPWYLLAIYAAFLVFFTWYVLEYQLPDYLEKGPIKPGAQASQAEK